MQSFTDTGRSGPPGFLRRTEAWLDHQGKGAWIAAMVLGFVLFWPLGLALLAYMIWGKKMFASRCAPRAYRHGSAWGRAPLATGHTAFDSYKAEALRRLEEEQAAFEAFLHRLRSSKDKSEFDTFMEERARATAAHDAANVAEQADEAAATPKADSVSGSSRPGEY